MNENRPQYKPKSKYINNDGLYLQAIISACVVLLAIMTIFIEEFSIALGIILSMLMFVMVYNNETSYGRDKMSMVYRILGFLFLILTLVDLFY